jgi:hypothetical protein
MPTVTFGESTGHLADAYVGLADTTTWPPVTDVQGSATTTQTIVDKSFTGTQYQVRLGLLAWDTSSIPDNATITSAELRLFSIATTNIDGASFTLGAQWYNAWDLTHTGEYTFAPSPSDAITGIGISSIAVGVDVGFTLLNPTSVNKSGQSALRLYIEGSATPTGNNRLTYRNIDDTTTSGDEPRLVVTYTVPNTETLRPTAVSGLSNLTGSHTDIDQDPDGTITDAGLVGSDPSGSTSTITRVTGADNTGNPTTSSTITIPTVQVNDIILVSAVNAGATATGSISDNSGVGSWSNGTGGGQVATANGNTMAGTVWWKRITNAASESGATVTISGMTDSTCSNLGVWRGCATSGSPIDGTPVGEANASANNTQAGITTLTDGAMVILNVFYSDNTNATSGYTATSPATLTERSEITSSGGADSGLAVAADLKATAGATGAFSWNPGTNQISISIAFALKPAVTAPSTVNTQADAAMADPTGTLAIGAATGEIRARFRKKGTGSNPQGRIEVRQAGATVSTPIADTTVTESDADGQLVFGNFDQDLIDGAPTDVTCRFVGTGASGGLTELVAVEWNAQTVIPTSFVYLPFHYTSSLYRR